LVPGSLEGQCGEADHGRVEDRRNPISQPLRMATPTRCILPVHWKVKEGGMKIGELAKLTNTSAKTIRFYEDSGLLPPPARSASGYRDYGPDIVDRLRFIHRGQAAGLTLQKVRQILAIRDRGEEPCGHVRQVLNTRLDQVRAQIAELLALEGHLQTLLDRPSHRAPTEHDHSTVCWILESDLDAAANVELAQPRD
jgi:DNA-binding transcriptional MerR regulator